MPAHILSLVFNTFLIPESSFAYIRRTTSGFLISCKWLPASGASLDLQPPPLCELSEVQGYLHLCLWWGELALGDFMQYKKKSLLFFYENSCQLSFYGWQKILCTSILSHSPSLMVLCLFLNSLYRGMLTSLPICSPPGQLPRVTKERNIQPVLNISAVLAQIPW